MGSLSRMKINYSGAKYSTDLYPPVLTTDPEFLGWLDLEKLFRIRDRPDPTYLFKKSYRRGNFIPKKLFEFVVD
jgi:hypothetical protein